jgi:hypothetical protein
MAASKPRYNWSPEEASPPPEVIQAKTHIDGERCPRCHGGRVRWDIRPGKIVRDGPHSYTTVKEGSARSCLDCWHKWTFQS